ncbi:MAG: L,D-transpeptidase family protein [Ignavibacteriaceae bacterium]|nr:L,D-transpeptidase family protein [Ignavibacteriaceae bacterium]
MHSFITDKLGLTNFLALLILVLTTLNCEQEKIKIDSGLNEKLMFNLNDYKNHLKAYLSSENSDSTIFYLDTLKQFYSEHDFQPQFIKTFEEKEFIDSLLLILNNAGEHGLDPKFYHASDIRNEFQSSLAENVQKSERYNHLAKTELLTVDAILKYSMHMRFGALNPQKIFLDSYYLPIADSLKRDLFAPLNEKDILSFLKNIQPKNKKYQLLQAALKQFQNYSSKRWDKIQFAYKKYKLGDKDSTLSEIYERLLTLGFWKSAKVEEKSKIAYDSSFAVSVKNFQKANGLIDDGIINKATIEKLNTPLEEYINKIKVNLERFRWYDYSDTARYILVNIPDFRLYVIENKNELFNITVCTGRKRYANFAAQYLTYKRSKNWKHKPEDWETPILYSQISHLILNPTWTVPSSIMREEIASKLRRDSTYLKKANFRVYKNGSMIDPTEVKLADLNSGNIPYTIIQNPGAGNALGKIKFMFNNPFGVYLHDTPTRAPFKYVNRAVSHGCVRVEKPLQLAEYILKNNSKWTLDYLKIEIGLRVDDKNVISEFKQKRSELRKGASFGETTEVKLDNSIPLFIDYYTAWVDHSGVINFRDDVYRQDKIILESLAKIK